ncbi:MAG TPA: decaprenyl-phosphate phosphoribosyltransferase [Thermomicrobiales bacterium]|nr:decaprenyl-phosphate phosphoribosyltransferase [Thermomicrobiales bacterium]
MRQPQPKADPVGEDDARQLTAAFAAPADAGVVGTAISAGSVPRRRRSAPVVRLPPLVRALRPLQWTKNAVVFAALVFSGELFEVGALLRTVLAAAVFCCASSAMYLVNDLRDVEGDRVHPKKRHRPIAAGLVSPGQAGATAAALFAVAVAGGWLVGAPFLLVILMYVGLMVAYSYGLKRLVILDVFAIAAGFVLRAVGGAVAIAVPISPWLYLCTLLLALFLGFGKRRHELTSLEADAVRHRANLDAYSVPLLDQIIGIVASAIVMAYSLYTFDAPNLPGNQAMMLTIPFVVYAVFRYLYLTHRRDLGGAPEVLLFADRSLLACIVGWGLVSITILYLVPR